MCPEEIDDTLAPFKLLSRSGSDWEKAMYRRLDKKLADAPQDCGAFEMAPGKGNKFVGGVTWEIDSIRIIYDEVMYDEYDKIPIKHDYENGMYFRGVRLQSVRQIIKGGFEIYGPGSGCWFGNGAYFTKCLPYAQHYIGREADNKSVRSKKADTGLQLCGAGRTVYIMGALMKVGDLAVVPEDQTPPGSGYQGPYRNVDGHAANCDSHVAYVTPSSEALVGFRPTTKDKSKIDEYVLFDKKRALPRFIIGLKRLT